MTGLVIQAALVLALGAGPATYRAQTAPAQRGFAVMYAPNMMERVARVRGIVPQPCMIAWTYARDRDIGWTWLRVVGPAGVLDCLTVDLPQNRDRLGLVRRGIVVELGFPSRFICGAAWRGRAVECPVEVWVIPVR